MRKLRIQHISDTHTCHELLRIDKTCDMIIHSGDCSNHRDPHKNEIEVRKFIDWYSKVDTLHKIFVPGNHETSIEAGLITREDFETRGIVFLQHEHITIEGRKIFGSPYQPSFGKGWAYNVERKDLDQKWEDITDDTDILVVHGPPKTILDLVVDKHTGDLEHCGCAALKRHVLFRIKPKLCLFGHIHNNGNIDNAGVLKLSCSNILFSNGSVCTDGKFGVITSHGNILEI